MMNYPLSRTETHAVSWLRCTMPLVATAVITFLSVMSVAVAQG